MSCLYRNVNRAVDSGDERVVRAALGAGRLVDLKRAEVAGPRKIRLQWEVREHEDFPTYISYFRTYSYRVIR